MGWLLDGVWPDRDVTGLPWLQGSVSHQRAGQPIAASWRFAYAGLKADMEFHRDFNLQKRFWSCHMICSRCMASSVIPGLEWTDMRPSAGWRRTLVSTSDYLRDVAPEPGAQVSLCDVFQNA